MEYVCSIGNKKFSTEEELVKHMISNYTIIDTTGGDISAIHSQLQNEFPFAKINAVETDDYNSIYGKYLVNMIASELGADLNFYLGEFSNVDYYHRSYTEIEEAVSHYKRVFSTNEIIIDKLKARYSPDEVKTNQIFESDLNNMTQLVL